MELHSSYRESSALLVGTCLLLILQNADAQIQSTNSTVPVPGWGIALLVMLSMMAALVLTVTIFLPLWCRNTENDCQDGVSFYSPHALCMPRVSCHAKPREPCNVQCEEMRAETQN